LLLFVCSSLKQHVKQGVGIRGAAGFAQHAEPEAVVKGEAGVLAADFIPEPPGTKVLDARLDVMKKNDTTGADFRKPGAEIRADGLIGMKAVNVQQVDAVIGEMLEGFLEAHAQQIADTAELL